MIGGVAMRWGLVLALTLGVLRAAQAEPWPGVSLDSVAQTHWMPMRAGGQAQLEQVGPFGRDGHMLFDTQGGARVWGPLFERYLQGK